MLRGEETELHGHDEYVIEFRDGKAARVDDYFDPAEALAEVDPG
jgi:ketosteroid isomerase-like protein